jgi:tetratricopeptide (TPR) repeat protein
MVTTDPQGDLKTALQHAASLLYKKPALAEEQALEILKIIPEFDPALHILASAYRFQGKTDKALEIMMPLSKRLEKSAPVLLELGLCLKASGKNRDAIKTLRKAANIIPDQGEIWRNLAILYGDVGEQENAYKATNKLLDILNKNPEILNAAKLFDEGKIAKAEASARDIIKKNPIDVVAMRLLAEIGLKIGQIDDARKLLEHCVELTPYYDHARHNYAVSLYRKQKLEEAMQQIKILLGRDPANHNYPVLMAAICVRKGDFKPALEIYEDILEKRPEQGKLQLNYGHTLKTVGRIDDAIKAYRTCIEVSPNIGETYWSLANLKVFRFSDEDLENMLKQVIPEGGDPDDQGHLAFAIGKAYEDRKEFDKSFEFYQRGNDIRRQHHRYDPKINIYDTVRQIKLFDHEFLSKNEGQGCQAADPIFIVGLPRAGSTLIEQILASHSQVDGTSELTDIIALSRKIGDKKNIRTVSKYPEILSEMTAQDFKELGESYIETTRIQRNKAPYFIDKMPNNFKHIGLIHTILPNAKIIDARRHPMGGCFSGFKQLFANGQTFTYNLTDIGLYYRDYVKLMDHWDEVLPGRVHRVQYEDMVSDTENRIKALLEYCGLEFEEACLNFYNTKRAVRTPSSEQVRQPIFTKGVEQWRNYEQHLGPLKEALGPLLERYPID